MSLSLRQIRSNCADARSLMERAREEKFALGAFNLDNQETLKAVVAASVKKQAPVLVEVSQGEIDALGIDNVRDMVDNYREAFGIHVWMGR